jgi:fatty-acyl-CoA synthase
MIDFDAIHGLDDVFRYQARVRPDAVAMMFDDAGQRTTTYGELNRRANLVANALIAEGVRPQTRVGFIGKNSDLYFEAVAGAFRANAVMVAVNWRLAPPEVLYILDNAQAELLFVGAEYYSLVEKIRDRLPRLRRIVAMDGGHPEWPDFGAWRDAQPDSDPGLTSGPYDTVIQMYTSGTTGHPKGVELTNANYMSAIRQGIEGGWANWDAEDRVSVFMPCFHVSGTNLGLLAFAHGALGVIIKDVNLEQIVRLVENPGITRALFVPAVILFLLQVPGIETRDLSHIKEILYGASPISDDVLKRAQKVFGCDFIQVYGLTETTGAGTWLSAEDHRIGGQRLRSCGRANPGVGLRVVDSGGRDVATGEVGEILMRGAHIMKGYWANPEATSRAIVDGWFRTGDAGYMDADGFLYIHDRVKDMIISGGENIYPAEVENALFGHPAVADVAVIGVPDEKWGEAVKAFVVPKPGERAEPDDIIAYAREQIAGYKVPRSIDFVTALPRNPSGKILRRELRAPFWEGRDRGVS